MGKRINVFWRNHHIGSFHTNDAAGTSIAYFRLVNIYPSIRSIDLPEDTTIREIRDIDIEFDPQFADLYGMTGITLEGEPMPKSRADLE